MRDAASDTQDARLTILATASSALALKNAADAIKTGQGATIDGEPGQLPVIDESGTVIGSRDASGGERIGGIDVSLSIGSSSSSSTATQTSDRAAGSTLTAGHDIRIAASGAGKASDLTIQDSRLAAGNTLSLKADDEIRLLAAANSDEQHSSNTSRSASVGVSFGTSGLLVNAGAGSGRGQADGADTTWTNSALAAGHTLLLESGGDTTLKGAVARGEQVIASVGTAGQGNLRIESLQDTSTFTSQQQNAGFSLSLGIGSVGASVGGNLGASRSRVNSDFASVAEQSGIRAGDGGFQVSVKGDSELKGAVVASTQSAVDSGRNSFTTDGTLTTSDIQNRADFSATSTSVNLGSAVSFDGTLKPGGTSAGFGKDDGSAGSTTEAGISGIAGNTAVRSGDAESGIARIFDADKVQKEIEAQTKITQMFGQLAPKAVGVYAASKLKEAGDLRAQARTEKDPDRIRQLEAQAGELENHWGD